MATIPLSCRCGAVRGSLGDVAPDRVNHVTCYCDDCRAFVHFLERPDQLDGYGGVGIVQVDPTQVRFTDGQELLRCMRLSPKGMNRWYSDCCKTPMGNTLGARVPFVGLLHGCLGEAAINPSLVGEPEGCNARSAIGSPPGAHPRASARLAMRTVRLLARWALAMRGKENPYFDSVTRNPKVTPQVLTPEERLALRQRDREGGSA